MTSDQILTLRDQQLSKGLLPLDQLYLSEIAYQIAALVELVEPIADQLVERFTRGSWPAPAKLLAKTGPLVELNRRFNAELERLEAEQTPAAAAVAAEAPARRYMVLPRGGRGGGAVHTFDYLPHAELYLQTCDESYVLYDSQSVSRGAVFFEFDAATGRVVPMGSRHSESPAEAAAAAQLIGGGAPCV